MIEAIAGAPVMLKLAVSALLLPPASLILLVLAGAWRARRRPREGSTLVAIAALLLWLSGCVGAARWVEQQALAEPAPLDAADRARLKRRAAAGEHLAIVVLGGGMNGDAREYGGADPTPAAFMRLRYAVWLSRQTSLPIAASGGQGWAGVAPGVPAEATRMAQVAQEEYGLPLRWVEPDSRDTHENAVNTVALLRAAGVREIVLVSHGSHLPRALREFRAAAAAATPQLLVMPAAMGQAWPAQQPLLAWLPSAEGARRMHVALREWLGLLVTPADPHPGPQARLEMTKPQSPGEVAGASWST